MCLFSAQQCQLQGKGVRVYVCMCMCVVFHASNNSIYQFGSIVQNFLALWVIQRHFCCLLIYRYSACSRGHIQAASNVIARGRLRLGGWAVAVACKPPKRRILLKETLLVLCDEIAHRGHTATATSVCTIPQCQGFVEESNAASDGISILIDCSNTPVTNV